jgi:hypothetical protein
MLRVLPGLGVLRGVESCRAPCDGRELEAAELQDDEELQEDEEL